jgi:hypothetical protein
MVEHPPPPPPLKKICGFAPNTGRFCDAQYNISLLVANSYLQQFFGWPLTSVVNLNIVICVINIYSIYKVHESYKTAVFDWMLLEFTA